MTDVIVITLNTFFSNFLKDYGITINPFFLLNSETEIQKILTPTTDAITNKTTSQVYLGWKRSPLEKDERYKITSDLSTYINSNEFEKYYQVKKLAFLKFSIDYTLISQEYNVLDLFEIVYNINYANQEKRINVPIFIEGTNIQPVFGYSLEYKPLSGIQVIDYENFGSYFSLTFSCNLTGLFLIPLSTFYPKLLKIISDMQINKNNEIVNTCIKEIENHFEPPTL